jgi:hypothetical protein
MNDDESFNSVSFCTTFSVQKVLKDLVSLPLVCDLLVTKSIRSVADL